MIYFYNNRGLEDLTESEIDMLGIDGIFKFANESNIPYEEVKKHVDQMETLVSTSTINPFDMSYGKNNELLNYWVDQYIPFFNNNAKHNKQAYVILGNIASGKSHYANEVCSATDSMLIDPDRFKMSETTTSGVFEGFTSLYNAPIDRERLQKPCSIASDMVLSNAMQQELNIVMPKAAKSIDKLEKTLAKLLNQGYDVHLILMDSALESCADRNYYRYLIYEYGKAPDSASNPHGRFVPLSVIKEINNNPYTIFAKSLKGGRYKSYRAFYNHTNFEIEEIDLPSMIVPEK